MSWDIHFEEAERLLVVTSHGTLNAEQIRTKSHEIIDAVRRHGVTRVLVDDRDMQPEIGTVDIYRLPELFNARELNRGVRAALVIRPESVKKADYEFLETVSHNSGYQIRLFTDLDAAQQWLLTQERLTE